MQGQSYSRLSLFELSGHRKYLNGVERQCFIRAAARQRAAVRHFCLTLLWSGARISEVLALTPAAIDIESGVASITPLAVHDENPICDTCERVIAVKAGGPAAAMEEALVYMDAYHEGDRLVKVQSEIRNFPARVDVAER